MLVAVGFLGFSAGVHGAIIVEDQFSYGATAGALNGNNGGIGFNTAWTDRTGGSPTDTYWTYTPNGLTFGSLVTSGGAARWSNGNDSNTSGVADRQLTSSLSAMVYGSFLFRIDERTTSVNSTAALVIGEAGNTDNTASLTMNARSLGEGRLRQLSESIGTSLVEAQLTFWTMVEADCRSATARSEAGRHTWRSSPTIPRSL